MSAFNMIMRLRSHTVRVLFVSFVCVSIIVLLGLSMLSKTQPREKPSMSQHGQTRLTLAPKNVLFKEKFHTDSHDANLETTRKPPKKRKLAQIYPDSLVDADEKFTILMLTFNRTDLMLRLLNHYSAMYRLDKIVIVWNNVNDTPPVELWASLEPHPVPVVFLPQQENKIQNRIQSFPEIKTKGMNYVHNVYLSLPNHQLMIAPFTYT